jgi:geranylgeranyl reductase family protein
MNDQIFNKTDSETYDVIIVGAGPAGGQCARELSKKGRKVLIIEKSAGIGRPNFSSGGTPAETFKDFNLPLSVGRGSWSKILIDALGEPKVWEFNKIVGYVFDFSGLKKFLVEEAIRNGAQVLVGTVAEDVVIENDFVVGVKYSGVFGDGIARGKVIVDASGPKGVLATKIGLRKENPGSASIGIEVIVENAPKEFNDTLAFYLSGYYVEHGYGWLFPFGDNSLKVGVAVYNAKEHGINEDDFGTADMMKVLNKFIGKFPQLKNIQPVDLHGGNIYITGGIEKHSANGFLTIGDSAMQINPLAGEGIRPALHSGRIAADIIDRAISDNKFSESSLKRYDKNWKKYIGSKWDQTFLISRTLYDADLSQKQWELIMKIISALTPEQIFKAGFNYDFVKVIGFNTIIKMGKLIKDSIFRVHS